jgi:hypothetical protein
MADRQLGASSSLLRATAIIALIWFRTCAAHDHNAEEIPEGEAISLDPIVRSPSERQTILLLIWRLWTGFNIMDPHMPSDICFWAFISNRNGSRGMIPPFIPSLPLGWLTLRCDQIVRSRWHVPLQTLGTIITIVAWFLGHRHKGRQFAPNIHASFASSLMLMLAVQVAIGVYLKLHLVKGGHSSIRKYVVNVHGTIGKLMPVISWVQMLFGGITALGFCREDHTGQCVAHFIMGSAFIGYGILMTILLMVGQIWLRRSGKSQEFFDSILIAAWGMVNTFTEHRWGGPWVKNDIQHTSMGVIWWCAGVVGIWLSRSRGGRPKRNLIPGIVLLLTGWGMSAHPQSLMLSTMVHTAFGYTLMAAGATRMIEIAFVLKDSRGLAGEPNSFQHLPPFVSSCYAVPTRYTDSMIASLCFRLSFHGRHGGADETSI